MLSLPPEVQLDVLKSLNFTQLFSLRQANFYFCNLINKYEGELARMKFSSIDLATCCPDFSCEYTFIDPQSGVFEITLNDQLKEKWQDAIDKSIPLFFDGEGVETLYKVFIGKKAVNENFVWYALKLENFPKNIEKMIIVRCWLEHLFKCAFEYCDFGDIVFNPEMINILFDNHNTIPTQFNIQLACFVPSNNFCKNLLDFVLNHLSICELNIYLSRINIEQYTDILFNILINEGNKFPKVLFDFSSGFPALYDLIVEHITTRDCSKMVPDICLTFTDKTNFKLSERAEKVEIELLDGVKYTDYQISNINYPNSRFYFYSTEPEKEFASNTLRIIKE